MSALPLIFDTEQQAPTLSILSMGLGQDSVTILHKLIDDKSFRAKYAPNELLVIFSNTHNEHPETYKYKDEVIVPLCKENGVEFYSTTKATQEGFDFYPPLARIKDPLK